MADVIEERGRLGIKAAIDHDTADTLKFDIREDEEQNVKLQETVELLVAAGYFRARIKGLSAFDKVVGGMVWCISSCNVDVDVDLLYSENASIGQKIALTEKIVNVLPQMSCPHAIEPHQIQGLDFIHIFPVVQWLVKQAIDAKAECEDTLQNFAVYKFNTHQRLPEDLVLDKTVAKSTQVRSHLSVATDFAPKRIYQKKPGVTFEDEGEQVHCTLLEYGWGGSVASGSSSKSPETSSPDQKVLGSHIQEHRSTDIQESALAKLLTDKSKNIAKVDEEVAYTQSESELSHTSTDPVTADDFKERISEMNSLLELMRAENAAMDARVKSEAHRLLDCQRVEAELDAKIAEHQQLETGVDKETLDELRTLLSEHDSIKEQEKRSKENCKRELAEMDAEAQKLAGYLQQPEANDDESVRQLAEGRCAAEERLKADRLRLADINRKVVSLQRKIDEVPSQTELNQYQRRFLELYNQVASKHRETKQFFTLYNTLVDVKTYMTKEIDLLDNIYNAQETPLPETFKPTFTSELEKIVDGVKQNKAKVERRLAETRNDRDTHRINHQELLDKQRLYYRTVKEFQQECNKNEELQERVHSFENS